MVWSSFLLSAPSWDMIGIKNSSHPPSQSNTNQIIVFCLPFFLALCFSHVVFNQIWRALRLIVDTGLHYYPNFTREDALWYFDKFAWDNTDLAEKEVSFFHRAKQEVSSIFLESGLQSSWGTVDIFHQYLSIYLSPPKDVLLLSKCLYRFYNHYDSLVWQIAYGPGPSPSLQGETEVAPLRFHLLGGGYGYT